MMSLGEIRRLSNEAAVKAVRGKKVPYTPFNAEELDDYPPFPFPNLGSYVPPGWTEIEDKQMLVDKTGFGSESEPALTIKSFTRRLKELYEENPEYGFAIVEEGEFQISIGVFLPS